MPHMINCVLVAGLLVSLSQAGAAQDSMSLRAGAATVDISPPFGPLIVSGGFAERTTERMESGSLGAQAVVLRRGEVQLALVVVDNCMIPQDVADQIKRLANEQTGIPVSRIMIAATHTHTAPSMMDFCLGTRQDQRYTQFAIPKIAEAIVEANRRVVPAQLGSAVVSAGQFTANRRWIRRSDTVGTDPFGERTVRAMMHPGHLNPEYIGPSGPVDPDLSLVSVATTDGKPVAIFANFAMHYFGGSAPGDYFPRFRQRLREKVLGADANNHSDLVCMMSQGTSGDIFWDDYSQPARTVSIETYAEGLANLAHAGLANVKYRADVDLAMDEQSLQLARRVPSAERLAWARAILKQMGDRRPSTQQEVYAEQAVYLHEHPSETIKLQAIRLGDLAMTAIPNEVFALTGLKLKAMSPLQPCVNVELANGAAGYIPPPEQHELGGYTTWPARTAGLEPQAEPKIVETLLQMLEKLAGRRRVQPTETMGPYVTTVLESTPVAHWRFSEMAGNIVRDTTGKLHAKLTPGYALYLNGPAGKAFSGEQTNRCLHLVGGSLQCQLPTIQADTTISLWFWNGLPSGVRQTTATLINIGTGEAAHELAVGGTGDASTEGKLVFRAGQVMKVGPKVTERAWHHLIYVRQGGQVQVYLDGALDPVIQAADTPVPNNTTELLVGADRQGAAPLEGKVDELTLFDRSLESRELAVLFGASHQDWETQSQGGATPRSPAETVAATHVPAGYVLELVAAEPLIADPVAIDWASDGSLWVVEMHDYPSGLDGHGAPGGRVRYLQDTNGDGRYDKSTILAENIPFPTGIKSWRNGALVTAAPEILFLADTDGDGQLDVRKTLFSGFFEGNQQLRVNGLRYGLDHWIYCASGSHHGGYGAESQIVATQTGTVTLLGSRDFRFQPDTSQLEPQSGPSQFGRNRNDWGDWFGVQNSYPLWHYVLEDHYLRRNQHYASPDPRQQVVTPANPKVYPARTPDKRFHSYDQAGRFTSACSGMIYRDDLLFGESDQQHGFTCEPFHQVVQHHVVREEGVSYVATRDPQETPWDFFASEDGWCRPVMALTGPDGALWVVDMYRHIIEHPQWLPEEGQQELAEHFRRGDDRGRIYRIYPRARPPRGIPDLDQLSPSQWVGVLESPNGWCRDKAQELLIQQQDRSTIPGLESLVRDSRSPLARLHALCVLDGLHALSEGLLLQALKDGHPSVRRHAIRLCESVRDLSPALHEQFAELANDQDPKVQLQLANTLGQWPDAWSGQLLGSMLHHQGDDPFLAAATFGALASESVTSAWEAYWNKKSNRDWLVLTRAEQANVLELAVQGLQLTNDGTFAEVLAKYLEGDSQQDRDSQRAFAGELIERWGSAGRWQSEHPDHALTAALRAISAESEAVAFEADASVERRVAALLVLYWPVFPADGASRLSQLVSAQQPRLVSQAALDRLKREERVEVATELLGPWRSYSPELRHAVLTCLISRPIWVAELLQGLEQGTLQSADLGLTGQSQVLAAAQGPLSERAIRALQSTNDAERAAVVRNYARVRSLEGDSVRGETLFRENCSACHRAREFGQAVGPNLAALTDRSVEALLGSILNPSRSVESKYQAYAIALHNGQVKQGMIESETATSLSLITPDGKRESVLREEIAEIHSSTKSLMPEVFDQKLSPPDMADLIRFLQQLD